MRRSIPAAPRGASPGPRAGASHHALGSAFGLGPAPLRGGILAILAVFAACKPDLGSPASFVDSNRYLAVVSEPPEVVPGDAVTLHALIVTPSGQVDDSAKASWAICTTPKPVSVNNAVSDDCVFDAQQSVAGQGLVVQAMVPMDACSVFGPDPPQSPPGQPPLRPTDPDPTGGYFQPIRSLLQDDPQAKHFIEGFGLPRITCNLPDAPVDVATAYREQYTANKNPVIARVLVSLDGTTAVDVPATVPSGQEATFEVLWTADSAESFPVFDRATRALVTTRESLRVSWFGTDGTFEHDHTGAAADDTSTSTQNLWTAPAVTAAETVHMWVVLRDSRGGTAVQGFDIDVTP